MRGGPYHPGLCECTRWYSRGSETAHQHLLRTQPLLQPATLSGLHPDGSVGKAMSFITGRCFRKNSSWAHFLILFCVHCVPTGHWKPEDSSKFWNAGLEIELEQGVKRTEHWSHGLSSELVKTLADFLPKPNGNPADGEQCSFLQDTSHGFPFLQIAEQLTWKEGQGGYTSKETEEIFPHSQVD